jgi:hypothetical protein
MKSATSAGISFSCNSGHRYILEYPPPEGFIGLANSGKDLYIRTRKKGEKNVKVIGKKTES